MNHRLLVDTNIVIWLLSASSRISRRARHALSRSTTDVVVSTASVWEIVLKNRAGTLEFETGLEDVLDEVLYRSPWTVLPVISEHLLALATLPPIHKDPFDRMLVAQALHENLTIVTTDEDIAKYAVPTLW